MSANNVFGKPDFEKQLRDFQTALAALDWELRL